MLKAEDQPGFLPKGSDGWGTSDRLPDTNDKIIIKMVKPNSIEDNEGSATLLGLIIMHALRGSMDERSLSFII